MKYKFLIILAVILFLVVSAEPATACEIDFKLLTKDEIKTGDEIIIQVNIRLSHRNCELTPEDTEFKTDGLKIIAATKWKEPAPGNLERKLKIKVLRSGNVELTAKRNCRKEGAKETLKLNVTS